METSKETNRCMVVVILITLFITLRLLSTWILLHIWNWFCESANFDLLFPINWGTIIGLSTIWYVMQSIFNRKSK